MSNFKDYIKLTNEMINESEKKTKKKLVWKKNTKQLNWKEANEYAKKLPKGWRLPSVKELLTLTPSNNPRRNCYWSSEKYESYPYFAWFVDLNYRKKFYSSVDGTYDVYFVKDVVT